MKPVKVPTMRVPARIICPPIHRMATQVTYIVPWKIGVLRTAVRKVRVPVLARLSLTSAKRSATWPSRTYALITRIAARSSCSASFSRSIADCSSR